MADKTENEDRAAELRRKAEAKITSQPTTNGEFDAKRLLHELQVHQIELEMQCEELREANVALRESEELLTVTLTSIQDPVFITDDEGYYTFICPNATNALGFTIEEYKAMGNISRLVGDELFDVEELKRQGSLVNLEKNIVDKNGANRAFLITIKKVTIGRGTRLYAMREITERKQAEERLRFSEKRSLAYLENSPACTKILDLDFNLQYMSEAGIKGLNIDSIEDYYGKPYPFYFYPESFRKEMTRNLQRAKETGGIVTQEAAVVDVEGNELWFHSTIVPVSDDEGAIEYLMVVSIDTTDRKQVERELEILIVRLQEKTAEQERFIYTVSHDLKSPLVTINGFCGVAKEDFASGNQEQGNKSLDMVSNAANRMQQLLNELLQFSRVGVKINPSEIVNMGDLIKEAMKDVSGVISENKTALEIESGLPDVKIDRQYFLQVLENLLTNASKYSNAATGGSKVKIGVTRNAEELICHVKDNGIGIETQYLEKVFGLFEKLDSNSDSTGVGLAIVKRIIENHGGRIWAESEGLGHGTTFFFTIPEA